MRDVRDDATLRTDAVMAATHCLYGHLLVRGYCAACDWYALPEAMRDAEERDGPGELN